MKKFCLIFFAVVGCVLMSCYEGGDVECGGSEILSDISYVTTSDFDSIRVYLGNKRICYGNMGGFDRTVYCKTSLDSAYDLIVIESGGFRNYTVDKKGMEKCIALEKFPPWFQFSCSFNSVNDDVDMKMSTLTIELFYGENEKKSVIENFIPGGIMSYFVSVADTNLYLGADESLKPNGKSDWTDWTRNACTDGLCLLQKLLPDREYCFEK